MEPERLPPTESAAYFHGLRVHLQTITWKTLDEESLLLAEDWGWKKVADELQPIQVDIEVAPEKLLKAVRCKCKSTSKNQCLSNLCSCRKHGIKCTSACGEFHGEDCLNKKDKEAIGILENEEEVEDENDDSNFENLFDILSNF